MRSADSETTAVRPPVAAWALENAVFSAAMAAQRLPWTDAPARALGLTALTREGVTRSLLAHLRRSRSGRPVRLSTPFGSFLVPLVPADAEALLLRADEEGALEPAVGLTAGGRRYGLSPHVALRRSVTGPGGELPALVALAVDEVMGSRRGDDTLEWRDWHGAMTRLSRRVVVGAAAVEDTLLSEVTDRATAAAPTPDRRAYEAWAAALRRRLAPYVEDPDPASLLGRLVEADAGRSVGGSTGGSADRGTGAAGGPAAGPGTVTEVVAHALALVSEAAATTALQALALQTVEPAAAPEEAVARALRRYPPVAAAVYRVRTPFVWEGLAIGAGTEVLCAPGWLSPPQGAALPGVWPSALCAAPADCGATRFAALVAAETVRAVTAAARPFVVSPGLTAGRLPAELGPRSLVVAFADGPTTAPAARRSPVRTTVPAPAPAPARGGAPASYGVLARSSAHRLEAHAGLLTACAEEAGWNADEEGERFRMALLGHADRCAKAADGVRRAADGLAD
ncbi:hypothetical protein [Streptomyces sp. NPDC054961]